LSEAGPKTIRRAHAFLPSAVIILFLVCIRRMVFVERDIETNGVLDVYRELGISIVA